MRTQQIHPALDLACLVSISLLLAGCSGVPTAGEKATRQQAQAIGAVYRPNQQPPSLPKLESSSSLGDFLRFAMLNQPQVAAAYYDWLASVERITQARSLADPQLTFSSDITDILMTLKPGLMQEFPGPGKLGLRAEVAVNESQAKYYTFETAVFQSAFSLKKAYYQLHFLEEKIQISQQTLKLLGDLEKLARTQNEVGKVTLQDVLRAQIEQERLKTDLANLEDSRNPLLAQLKAALGLAADQPNPPPPATFESTPLAMSPDALFTTALARNPRLKSMEAELRQAEAAIRLAQKARVPDYSLGLEADAKAVPTMVTPQLGITLPIWRDKIAAQIAETQAAKGAAASRLSAEQIALAVEFADRMFMLRQATRNLELLQNRLLPKAQQSLEVARTAYLGSQLDFLNVIDAERTLLGFQLAAVEASTDKELALAELMLVIAGQPPAKAPLLNQPTETGKHPKP